MYGVWKYFTVNDDDIDLRCKSYLTVGTLESYTKIRDYFGSDKVLPIYVEVEDGDRLIRAIHRERGSRCLNMRRCAVVFWQTHQISLRTSCMRRVLHTVS